MSTKDRPESDETVDAVEFEDDYQNQSQQTGKVEIDKVKVKAWTPTKEEEEPGIYDGKNVHNNDSAESAESGSKKNQNGINVPKDLLPKENLAYKITKFCIILVMIIWGVDFLLSNLQVSWDAPSSEVGQTLKNTITLNWTFNNSGHAADVIDLLKYVITASLSFFFGTTVSKK